MTTNPSPEKAALDGIQSVLSDAAPSLQTVQHDLFNTMQTILSSVEFLTMKEHDPTIKDAIVERMNAGANHFESQLKFLMLQFKTLKSDIEKKIESAQPQPASTQSP